ncbi:MAG: hypothetical protein WCA20_26995 [Candidatus Sulfotelmatobacter sp.]
MTNTKSLSRSLLLLVVAAVAGAMFVPGVSASGDLGANAVSTGSSQPAASDVSGTWSGTFQSDQSNGAPFTITVVINPDARGHLVGHSSLYSDCVTDVNLQVTVNGSTIVLAGSDADGNSLTFRGTIDKTGTLLSLRYIANGSASGKCETDQGSGTMGKR